MVAIRLYLPQDAVGAAGDEVVSSPGGLGSFFWWLLQLPGAVELLLAVLLLSGGLWLWRRLQHLVAIARQRSALEDYLFGVEQALHGDLAGARQRLTAVLASDPANHYARWLLGRVLAELGEAAAAHQQHLYLQRAFGIDSAANELQLAQTLLQAGQPSEAAAVAAAASERLADPTAGWLFVFRSKLQAGDHVGAAQAGRRLLGRRGANKPGLAAEIGSVCAEAGLQQLAAGDADAASAALAQAVALAADAPAVQLLRARLQALGQGTSAVLARLLAAGEDGGSLPVGLPAAAARWPTPTGREVMAHTVAVGLPVTSLAGLVPTARWQCRACGAPLATAMRACSRCGAVDSAELAEPRLAQPLASPGRTMDAIDHNRAHVQRLVAMALADNEAATAAAASLLRQVDTVVLEELLREAGKQTAASQQRAILLLQQAGPERLPELFAAWRALGQQRLLPAGKRTTTSVVAAVVQRHGRAALPHLEALSLSALPEERSVVIDCHLVLADFAAFQTVLQRFPPLEILHRLRKAEQAVLVRFLQALPRDHFVGAVLLRESAFDREDAVLQAIPGARHPDWLTALLQQRGPVRGLVRALLAGLGDPDLQPVAHQLLVDFGSAALDHLLAAFVDPERSAAERQPLAAVLVAIGAPAVGRICASFGSTASALDEALLAVLQEIGSAAVPELLAAYADGGWLELVTLGMVRRHTNRREMILRCLGRLDAAVAQPALQRLLQEESDADLRLRLQQLLHGGAAPDGGRDG